MPGDGYTTIFNGNLGDDESDGDSGDSGDDEPTVWFYPVPEQPIRPWADDVEGTIERIRGYIRDAAADGTRGPGFDGYIPP